LAELEIEPGLATDAKQNKQMPMMRRRILTLARAQSEKPLTLRESRSASGPGIAFENTSASAL
jgi:hypothetical protein